VKPASVTVGEHTLTIAGGTPDPATPEGAVIACLVACVTGDEAAARGLLARSCRDEPFNGMPLQNDTTLDIVGTRPESPDAVIVLVRLAGENPTFGPQEQVLPVPAVREDGRWRVDLMRMMDLLMGDVQKLLEGAVKPIAEAMGTAMDAVAQGVAEAMGGTAPNPRRPKARPAKAKRHTT
jgi:hypothetical protein